METPESIYIVMYPSDDPANEAFDTFRPHRTFLEFASALIYVSKVPNMILGLSVAQIYSERVKQSR